MWACHIKEKWYLPKWCCLVKSLKWERKNSSCEGIKGKIKTPHAKRKLWLVKLVFCLIWCFSPTIFVIFVRIKKTENKSKEGNCGVLTFCTHHFFFFAALISQGWKTTSLGVESMDWISQWAEVLLSAGPWRWKERKLLSEEEGQKLRLWWLFSQKL